MRTLLRATSSVADRSCLLPLAGIGLPLQRCVRQPWWNSPIDYSSFIQFHSSPSARAQSNYWNFVEAAKRLFANPQNVKSERMSRVWNALLQHKAVLIGPNGKPQNYEFPTLPPFDKAVIPPQRATGLVENTVTLLNQLKQGLLLELPSDIGWVHVPETNGNLIYLRPAVSDMLRQVLSLYEGGRAGVVILGKPRIGKSFSISVMLWFFAGIKRPVILELQGQSKRLYLEPSGRVTDISGSVPASVLSDRSTVYLFDPGADTQGENLALDVLFTVNCSSPNRAHFKEFLKRVQQRRFMPPWSLEDLLRVQPYIAPQMSDEDLKARYDIVDGSLDKLFGSDTVDELRMDMDGAMALNGIKARLALNQPLSDRRLAHIDFNAVPNDLCSIISSPPFTQAQIVYGSPYVMRSLDEVIALSSQRLLAQRIRESLSSAAMRAKAGVDFEHWAGRVLGFGGNFRCHFFDQFGKAKVNGNERIFPLLGVEFFKSFRDVTTLKENVHYRPISKREKGIDSFFLSRGKDGIILRLVQFPVGAQKDGLMNFLMSEYFLALFGLFEELFPQHSPVVEFLYVIPREGTDVLLSLSGAPFQKSVAFDKLAPLSDSNSDDSGFEFGIPGSTVLVKPLAVVLDLDFVYLPKAVQ